jgi:hypothetical protein
VVSSRTAEKQRRREERLQRERRLATAERRAHVRNQFLAGLFALAALGGATVLILVSHDGGGPAVASAAAPFGQHYAGLDARREAAHVPTMMQTMNGRVHFHPLLAVYVDGKRISVPADIGIDPKRDSMRMAGLHTHDASGTIHVEGVEHATLGQFFRIWGVALSSTRLGPYRAGSGNTVRMWVDGKPSQAFGSLKLADRQRIVIKYQRSS